MQLNLKDGDIDSILNEIEENERTHEKEEDTELMEMSSSADDEFEPQPIKSALEIAKIGTDDDLGVIEPSQHKMNQDSLIENANREDILKRKLNYLDERTQIIIIGYVRNAQKILASIVPSEVIFITLSYVDDHFLVSYDRINIVFLLDDFFSSEEIDAFTWIMEESMNELIRGDCGYSNGFKTIRITEYPSKHQTIMNGSMITCDVSQESVLISEMMDASLQDMIIQNIKQETQRQIILSAKPTIKYKSATGNKYTATTGLEDTDTQSSDSGSQSWFSWILKFIVIQIGLCCLLLACFFGIKVRTKQIQTDKLAIEKQISESKRFTVTSTPQVNPNKDCQGLRSFLQSPRMEGVVNGTAPSPYRTGPYPMEQRKIVSSAPKFNNSGGISRFAMPNNQDIEEEDAAADEDEEMEMYEDGKVYARYIKQLMVKMRSNKKHDKVRSKNTVKTTSEVEMMSDYEAADIDGPFSFKSTYQMDPDDKTGLVHRIDTDTTFPSIPLHDMFSSSHNFTDTMGDNEDAMSGAETIHTQPQPQSVASDSDSDEEEDTMSYVELPKNRTNGVNASNREISSTTSTLSLGPPHKTSFVTICDKCGTTHPKNFNGVSCMHFAKFNNY